MNARRYLKIAITLIFALSFSAAEVPARAESLEQIRQEKADIRKMAKTTLTKYEVQPSAKEAVLRSAGYAVFSSFGTKIFVAGGGSGKGIVVDNKTRKETFMKMIELQGGFGLGVKKFNLVWVFEYRKDLKDFINSGWELGGQTTVAAKVGDEGGGFAGAMSVSPGIWLYQLTDEGLAIELTVKGTKYYKDDDLN
jgi:lipid-binding SYLF domain-containing protein